MEQEKVACRGSCQAQIETGYQGRHQMSRQTGSYQIILPNNGPFHIEAIREKEIRKIQIVVDEITPADIKKVEDFKLPRVCIKEILSKKKRQERIQ